MALISGFDPLEAFIEVKWEVALMGVNGKYWNSADQNGIHPIWCHKDTKDPSCKFTVKRIGSDKVYLLDYRGIYLSRYCRSGTQYIEAAKNPADECCEFDVFIKGRKVLFRADNGGFLRLTERETIQVVKELPDKNCEFTPTSAN